MLKRIGAVLGAMVVVLAGSAVPAAAATVACRPGADSPRCQVWSGKVSWVADGDTPQIDIAGDGTTAPVSVRLIGVQAMEQSVYSKTVSKRRGECHALAATARVEYLFKRGGGTVRLTAMKASSHSDVRNRPLRSVATKINGAWYDIGLDLIRGGYTLWLPRKDEYAWNPAYRQAAQQAAKAGKNLYDTDACGSGPTQNVKVGLTVNYDAAGDDGTNINGEWFRIDNPSTQSLSLAGWWVRDAALRRYTFAKNATVVAGGSVWVHPGKGTATATRKYWGLSAPVFDNPTFDKTAIGDGGYLFDPQGDLRAWMIYP